MKARADKSGIVEDKHYPGRKGKIIGPTHGGYTVRWFDDKYVGPLSSQRIRVIVPEEEEEEELLPFEHFKP